MCMSTKVSKFPGILGELHSGMMSQMIMGSHSSEPFNVQTGVRQCWLLAPVPFNIFIVRLTTLLYRKVEKQTGVAIDFRLTGAH